jgi:hypothetical protein
LVHRSVKRDNAEKQSKSGRTETPRDIGTTDGGFRLAVDAAPATGPEPLMHINAVLQ